MRAFRWVLIAVAVLAAVSPLRVACGHGGQRIVPMLVEVESEAGAFRVRYSFDVGLLLEGVSVDREWLAAQTVADLQAIADDASVKLREWFVFSVGGEAAEGVYLFPDLDLLADPEFDNGEPPGHLLVESDVAFGAGGGAVLLGLAEDAPGTVVTKVVDGKTMRRPDVILPGEERALLSVEAYGGGEADAPAADAEVVGDAEVDAVGEMTIPDEVMEAIESVADEPVEADRWVLLHDGFWHVWSWWGGHLLLAVALFLGCRGWRDVGAQFGALATGAVAAVLIGVGFQGIWTEWVFIGLIVALAADAGCGDEVRPWRLALALAVGFIHGAGQMGQAGDWLEGSGEMMPVVMGPVLGDAVLLWLAFVVFGWGWGISWFGAKVRRPAAWLTAAAAVSLVLL